MVATYSTMQELGNDAPGFSLPNVRSNNTLVDLQQFADKPLLIMFICNHCPFVLHIMPELAELANKYMEQGFAAIAISSNDVVTYPQDSPQKMAEFADQYAFQFPYCYDESQQVAKDYDAACTPDFFVYDQQHKLRYRGQMDDSRPSNDLPVTGHDLEAAMQAILDSELPDSNQQPSIGCNIKWRST